MTVKGNHPLAEIIARKLLGIEIVPVKEQYRMCNRACKAAVEYHEKIVEELKAELQASNEAYEVLQKLREEK